MSSTQKLKVYTCYWFSPIPTPEWFVEAYKAKTFVELSQEELGARTAELAVEYRLDVRIMPVADNEGEFTLCVSDHGYGQR